MIIVACLLNAIAGGAWRRILGGWLKQRRSYVMTSGALLGWPFWLVLPWWGAILATGACLVFWSEGHRFDKWTIVLRYPLVGVIYPILERAGVRDWTAWAEVVIGAAFWGAVAGVLAL